MTSLSPAAPGAPMSTLGPHGSFGRFADHLLRVELPALPADRRESTVEFVCRRADQVPTPLRVGIVLLAVGVGMGQRTLGDDRTTAFLRSTRLPLVAELARMVRSLGFAYVWETWPGTAPDGDAA